MRLEKCLPDAFENLDEYSYDKLKKKLNDYYLPRRNKNYDCSLFLKNEIKLWRINTFICSKITRES